MRAIRSPCDNLPREPFVAASQYRSPGNRTMLNPHVFRAYDVRGLVGPDINPDVFRQVGRAYATLIRRNGGRRTALRQDKPLPPDDLKARLVDGRSPGGVGAGAPG